MTYVPDHYANHLGPVYAWMVGGIASAIKRGTEELDEIGVAPVTDGIAIDLGAGFGMHAIPLAHRGYRVLAIDSCAALLEDLHAQKGRLPIRVVDDDLLAFPRHLNEHAQLVLCMGDTLTHLPDAESVLRLISTVASALQTGGKFVATFRDYSVALSGDQRFIPVRSDGNRMLTCFLEYADAHVTVHDLLYECNLSQWELRVSSYRKLRLSPPWIIEALRSNGFTVRQEPGLSGMVRLVALRA